MCGIVYLVTNTVSGKQYVGQTTHRLKVRWKHHLKSVRNGSTCALHCAIRKYGAVIFKVEQIDSAETLDKLNEKEVYYIATLKTLAPGGYNLTIGGDGVAGYSHTDETRRRLSRVFLGKGVREKTQQRRLESLVNRKYPLKQICSRGHRFDAVNTYITPSTGAYQCLTCYYLQSGRKLPERLQQYAHSTSS